MATPPGTGGLPTSLRAAGASTIFFDLKLATRVGTPDAPADPATIVDTANKEFDAAAKQTGCATPLIAENELFGAATQTPWSPGNAQYRANVLALLTQLTARGAHTYLLISSPPYGGDTAGDWWRAVAQVSDIVREFFPSAPEVSTAGPIAGSRTLRNQMRQAVTAFTSFGVPASRLGLMLEFESGIYGRERDQGRVGVVRLREARCPRRAADRGGARPADRLVVGLGDVHGEVGLRRRQAGRRLRLPVDEESEPVRRPCRGRKGLRPVAHAGPAVCARAGVLHPRRERCHRRGDPDAARGCHRRRPGRGRDRARLGGDACGGSGHGRADGRGGAGGDRRELRRQPGGVSRRAGEEAREPGLARAALAAELRRATVSAGLAVPPVSAASVAAFYDAYGGIKARLVTTKAPVAWLGGRTRGVALQGFAPARVLSLPSGHAGVVQTAAGAVSVQALEPRSLSAPCHSRSRARRSSPHSRAWQRKTRTSRGCCSGAEGARDAICAGDDVPSALPVGLEDYLPFLALS